MKYKNYKAAIANLDDLIKAYRKLTDTQFRKLSENEFEAQFGEFDRVGFYGLRNAFFSFATMFEESDFDDFYDRFSSPAGLDRKTKPIAWVSRFIPDLMEELVWSERPIGDRIKEYRALYIKCRKLEKDFNKKLTKKVPKRNKQGVTVNG